MVQAIIILCALALHVGEGVNLSFAKHLSPLNTSIVVVLALGLVALFVQISCVLCARAMDRGSRFAIHRADRILLASRFVALVLFIAACVGLDWIRAVREGLGSLVSGPGSLAERGDLIAIDEVLALLPMLLFLAAGWWSFQPLDRRLRDAAWMRMLDEGRPVYAPPTRIQFVWSAMRHQVFLILLPLMLITAWQEAVARYVPRVGIPARHLEWAVPLIMLAGAVMVFAATPALLKAIWDTTPIGEGPFRDMLRGVCERYRVRIRSPLLWRTHGGMVNGAVLGLAWPFRYMLFTDALLDTLTQRQVEAVVAHEVGHVRHHHIAWLGVSMIATLATLAWGIEGIAYLTNAPPDAWYLTTGGIAIPLVLGLGVFGFISRRFEWQADAFAVRHLSEHAITPAPMPPDATPPVNASPNISAPEGPQSIASAPSVPVITPAAVETMSTTLLTVASVNGVDPRRFGFRHGSIAERIRRLRAVARAPVTRLPIDRQVTVIKIVAAILFLASVGATVADVVYHMQHPSAQPMAITR